MDMNNNMNMDNNNMNKYSLQNRIKWRKINFYKNIKLFDKDIWERLVNVLFNSNNNNSNINLSVLFVSCFNFQFYK